jgi:hypothetical protein
MSLSTLFSNTLSPSSSLNVTDQVSHPYKTAGSIIVANFVILTLADTQQEGPVAAAAPWQHLHATNYHSCLHTHSAQIHCGTHAASRSTGTADAAWRRAKLCVVYRHQWGNSRE